VQNKRPYIIIFLLVATELIGFGLIIPILPQIANKFTSSGFLLGFLLSSYSLAQFVAAPYLGHLSDRVGRKPVLIASKIGTILSYILLANSATFTLILLSRLLDGFTGGNIAVARAYLADITSKEHRSKAMAVIGVAFGTGFIFGPAIGGFCYSVSQNFALAGYIGAFLSLISLCITWIYLKEPENKKLKQSTPILKNIHLISPFCWVLLLISAMSMIVFSGFETSFSLYTFYKFGFSEEQNSYLFLVIGVLAFFIQGSFTRFSIQPIQRAVSVALVSLGTGLCLSNYFNAPYLSLGILGLLLFGIAILNTHLPAEISTQNEQRGFIMGVYESINSVARIIGPLIIYSAVYRHFNIIYFTLGGACFFLLLISYPLLLLYRPSSDHKT
jgi:MFS transporter, DHA1 family, tetracycline resistance protein